MAVLLASGPVGTLFGYHIAEAMHVPSASLALPPLAKTGDFAPPVLTLRSFGRRVNRVMWRLGAMVEKICLKQINELRVRLGLPRARLRDFQNARETRRPFFRAFIERDLMRFRRFPS